MSLILAIAPICAAFLVLLAPPKLRNALTITTVALISICTLLAFGESGATITLSEGAKLLITVFDFALLAYFFSVGVRSKAPLIWALAIAQALALAFVELNAPQNDLADFIVDDLSIFMFCLVSFIGGLITIFALKYIAEDTPIEAKRSQFIAILLAFLGVMNLLAQTDNLIIFFTLFECTTLASFLLVRFRKDEQSIANALRVLWMNQIGGLAIIVAVIFCIFQLESIHWSQIINLDSAKITLAPFALLAVAAMIKGAQPPFENWLLGAMVAPTPVSAILHSSTMVKIAPFMILKLAPVIGGTLVGFTVGLIGAISFVAMSVLALRETILKRVLAYSTIALLGLMILLASLNTPLAITACLALALIHALAKALLFLEAGVLEKVYHIKTIDLLDGLLQKAPKTAMALLIGFFIMSIPPFGVFMGKWLAIEASGSQVLWIASIAVGGSALTLLYFKVAGPICAAGARQNETLSGYYFIPTSILVFLALLVGLFYAPIMVGWLGAIAASITGKTPDLYADGLSLLVGKTGELKFWYVASAMAILTFVVIAARKFNFANYDIVAPYNCAERQEPQSAPFLFFENAAIERYVILCGATLFVIVVVAGVLGL